MITKKKEETEIKLEGFEAILQAQQKEFIAQKNHLLAGIEGEAKTGKSGLAMDTGFKTFYLDCDVGAVPTWKTNHDSTNRVLIYNPNAKDENGDSDPYKTQGNIRTFIAHVALEIKKSQEPILFVWDGIDSWLDDCTTYMTGMENSRMRPFKPQKQQEWHQRNNPFKTVVGEAIGLQCHRLFITHTKEPFRDEPAKAIWNRVDSKLHTVIRTNQRMTIKGMQYIATIKSSKYHPKMVGKKIPFCTFGEDGEVKWEGIPALKEMSI